MRITRAIDAFLDQMRLERDWTPRTVQSYYVCLEKMADWLNTHVAPDVRLSDLTGRPGT